MINGDTPARFTQPATATAVLGADRSSAIATNQQFIAKASYTNSSNASYR
jgi:hypothetical protein